MSSRSPTRISVSTISEPISNQNGRTRSMRAFQAEGEANDEPPKVSPPQHPVIKAVARARGSDDGSRDDGRARTGYSLSPVQTTGRVGGRMDPIGDMRDDRLRLDTSGVRDNEAPPVTRAAE